MGLAQDVIGGAPPLRFFFGRTVGAADRARPEPAVPAAAKVVEEDDAGAPAPSVPDDDAGAPTVQIWHRGVVSYSCCLPQY